MFSISILGMAIPISNCEKDRLIYYMICFGIHELYPTALWSD